GFYLRSFNRFGFAQTMTGEIPPYLVATNSLFQPGVYAKVTLQLPTSVEAVGSAIPARYSLIQNYPNPFNPSTKIKYDLPKDGHTKLRVADLLGREVAILVDELQLAGSYSVTFNANRLSSGIYFYTLQSGTFRETMKMMVLK
ncbi:MAG: T9SS type A sorting domain-containing protein, partial [Bacteroidota bacterium]